jgi:hypothetical protein
MVQDATTTFKDGSRTKSAGQCIFIVSKGDCAPSSSWHTRINYVGQLWRTLVIACRVQAEHTATLMTKREEKKGKRCLSFTQLDCLVTYRLCTMSMPMCYGTVGAVGNSID